jgi:iron complex outermembrane recepter protein
LFLVISFCSRAAGSGFQVTGTVVDSGGGAGIEMATVALRKAGEEKIASATATGADGGFSLTGIEPGRYDLLVSFVGYVTLIRPVEIRGDMQVGKLALVSSVKTLQQAEVVAQKEEITKTAEKTVFNVANSPTNQTGTLEDVLRNMPGVSVDQKGNISISGKAAVKILVDGRPNAMAENDLQNFLKSIPATSIEAIELITNPGAKYDAEGTAGIINIKLKKGKQFGLNGIISAGYGILNFYNVNADLNYRKNKINFFADYSTDAHIIGNRWLENRTITVNDTTTHYNFNSHGTQTNITNNLKTGIDYFINDNSTFTYTLSGNYTLNRWYSDAAAGNMDSAENLLNSYNSTDNEFNTNYSVTNDINWNRKFDTAGQELNIGVTYTYLNAANDARLNSLGYDSNGAFNPANSLQLHNISSTRIHNAVLQLDYTLPFKKLPGYKFETGVKNEFTNNRNVYNANMVVNSVDQPDSLLSNRFNYTENIAAAYGILSGSFKKWLSYSAGLRGEHTYITSNNTSVNKNYFSLFPSASLTVNISDIQNLSAGYSRRIQRPQFRQINDVISYVDQYTTWQGNAFLQPSFSHLVNLVYTIKPKKYMFSLEADGNIQTNGFISTSYVDSNRITRSGVANGGQSKVFNLTFFCKLEPVKWWELQMNHTYNYLWYGYYQGLNTQPYSGSAYNFWANTDFKFWKNTVIEIGGWYNSRTPTPQGPQLGVGGLHASIKKSFLKDDRLTVSISALNILNTIKWQWVNISPGLVDAGSWQELNRVVMFTLRYRFGSGQQGPRREKDNGDRLGGGGGGQG